MKYVFLSFLLLISIIPATAQEKPIGQAEYVRMLYALQKDPGGKSDIIESLRRRGIDFTLTDGVRALTRSKGANDDELKRALEEADRRRREPAAAKLPTPKIAADVLEKARKNTLAAVDDMPDFVVKQQIQRSAAYAGTGNFRNLDHLVVAVSYRSSGQEDYRVLSLNGAIQDNARAKTSYEEAGGTSSTGEFVTVLATIFKPESQTKFETVDTDLLNGRPAIIFHFATDREHAKQQITAAGFINDSTVAGMAGKIWIDLDNFRVLRIESEATEIPDSFPIRTARRNIDYGWVAIAGDKYLLPTLSDVRLTIREKGKVFETRNVIRFKDYQKYGTDVIILDEDEKPIPEEKPNN